MIPILLIALTIFSVSCKSSSQKNIQEWEDTIKALVPHVPAPPEMEPVHFEDRDGGIWLSYNDYRALERDIIALREYIAKLETIIEFYREE
jgi:hypothetical protein